MQSKVLSVDAKMKIDSPEVLSLFVSHCIFACIIFCNLVGHFGGGLAIIDTVVKSRSTPARSSTSWERHQDII